MAGDSDPAQTQQAAGRGGTPVNGATVRRPRPPGPNDVQPSSSKGAPPSKNPLMRPRPWWISFLLILIVNYLLVQFFLPERPNPRIDVPYTFFKQQVAAGNVLDVTSRGDLLHAPLKHPIPHPPDHQNPPPPTL